MWMILSLGIFILYGGLLLVGSKYFGLDSWITFLTVIAGTPIAITIAISYLFFPKYQNIPIVVGIMTNLIFLAVAAYLQFLDFYFFVMLLVVGTITTVKKFKLLLHFIIISAIINILALIFLISKLEWYDNYRFFMQFSMYLYGSIFLMIQTYRVEQKEGLSDKALVAFSSLLFSTPNMMVITDKNRRVLYLSDQIAKFFQYQRKEFAIGQPLMDLVGDIKLKFMFANIMDVEGYYETIMELQVEGEQRFFKIVKDKLSGEFEGSFIDLADITTTVKSQQAAKEANKSKSEFLAAMSHEIRTPMNAIIGITQILLNKDDLQDEYRSALVMMYNSGGSLLSIINDILDLSKIETGKMDLVNTEYDMPSFIHDTAQLNIVRIGSKQIDLILDIDENLPSKMIGDELRLKQILNNLLSNAIKYSDEGHVKLSVSHSINNVLPHNKTSHSQSGYDTSLKFIVEDTGQGMKPEDQKRLFSEYIRFNAKANRSKEGTGIGLTIVKKLVEMMEGSIEVESEYGKGSKFTVIVSQKSVQCEVIGPELAKSLSNFTFFGENQNINLRILCEPMPYGKVLIVDDVETNLFVAEGLMSSYSLQIDTAISGFETIDKIKNGKFYDIIFMDHMMPQMDGIETTLKLRDMGYEGIIVALTANALVGNAEMFKRNKFDDFIPKPIDIRFLNDILNKYVKKK